MLSERPSHNHIVFRRLIRNFVSLAGAETFSKLITFAAFAYLARLLGPAGYGYVEWAGTILMCASLIVDQGFSAYGAREIAKSPGETKRLVAEVVTARFLLAGVGYFAIVIFAVWFVQSGQIRLLLLIYGLSLWILPFLLQWVFQGHDRMHLVGITQVIRQLVFVLAVFVFVRGGADLVLVGVAEISGVAAAALFSIWAYRKYFSRYRVRKPALSARLFREGSPIGLSQMFWVIKMFGATFIVGLVATAEDTGYFAGAMRIYIAVHTFVWLYYFNMLPSLSRAWEQGPEQLAGIVRHSIGIAAMASLVVGATWLAGAPFIMKLVYGAGFAEGTGALQWLAGACIAAAFSGNFRYSLIAAGHQGKEMFATATGSLASIILIPVGYWKAGTSGAAAALFIAEIIVLLSSWLSARRSLFRRTMNGFSTSETTLKTLPGATP